MRSLILPSDTVTGAEQVERERALLWMCFVLSPVLVQLSPLGLYILSVVQTHRYYADNINFSSVNNEFLLQTISLAHSLCSSAFYAYAGWGLWDQETFYLLSCFFLLLLLGMEKGSSEIHPLLSLRHENHLSTLK